ncbi:hypothetical protein ACFQ60_06890 [Streptomyces zhihengii]
MSPQTRSQATATPSVCSRASAAVTASVPSPVTASTTRSAASSVPVPGAGRGVPPRSRTTAPAGAAPLPRDQAAVQ